MNNDPDFLDAVEFGSLEDALMYSNHGIDIDVNDQDTLGRTPLMLAVFYKHYEVAEWLLTLNVDRSLTDSNGKTVLDCALEAGDENILSLLE